MPAAFVAGATGTLGRLIVDSLLRRGVQVRALVRPGNAAGREALEIERRKAGSTNVFDYLALQYAWVMNTGKASFGRLDNDRYPGVEPTSAEEFYRQALGS